MTLADKARSIIERRKSYQDHELEAYIDDLKGKMLARLEIVWADLQRRIDENDVKAVLIKDVFVYDIPSEFAQPFIWEDFAHYTNHLMAMNDAFNGFKSKVEEQGFSISFTAGKLVGQDRYARIYFKIKEGQ